MTWLTRIKSLSLVCRPRPSLSNVGSNITQEVFCSESMYLCKMRHTFTTFLKTFSLCLFRNTYPELKLFSSSVLLSFSCKSCNRTRILKVFLSICVQEILDFNFKSLQKIALNSRKLDETIHLQTRKSSSV